MNIDAVPPSDQADLYLPADWLELLEENPPGPTADEAARTRFTALIATTLPGAGPELVDAGAQALMAWRARLLARGVLSHGVVDVALDDNGGPVDSAPRLDHERWACWHVLTAVVALPPTSPELDLGEFLARVLGHRLDPEASYVESFDTDMGRGTGLLLQPELAPDPPTDEGPVHYGLATALSFEPGGGRGLLVTGVCLDPEQLIALGALVALIASRSRLRQAGSDVQRGQ